MNDGFRIVPVTLHMKGETPAPDKPKKEYAARLLAPDDYVFQGTERMLCIGAKDPGGQEYLSQIQISDDKYFRVIWTSAAGFALKGHDALNEASRRDREMPFEQRREPFLMGAFLAGIHKNVFTAENRLDSFLSDAVKYLNGELSPDWPLSAIGDFLDAGRELVPTVRVPHLLEKLKNYIRIGQQMDIFNEETKAEIEKFNITVSGLDLDEVEDVALFGVQTLFSDNGLKANYDKDGIKAFYFTMPDLCRVCGVPIITDKRGRNQHERRGRMRLANALERLSDKKRLLQYETAEEGIEYVMPVWNLMKFYSKKKRGKKKLVLGYAIFNYDNTLLKDIEGYFLLKPRGLNQQIKKIVGRHYTIYHERFFSYILTQANDKRRIEETTNSPVDWDIEINEKLLVESRLHYTAHKKARQIGRARDILNSCFAAAKKLEYCTKIDEGINKLGEKKYIIKLNRDKFKTLGNWKLKDEKELTGKK